jgi:hypothetical protein
VTAAKEFLCSLIFNGTQLLHSPWRGILSSLQAEELGRCNSSPRIQSPSNESDTKQLEEEAEDEESNEVVPRRPKSRSSPSSHHRSKRRPPKRIPSVTRLADAASRTETSEELNLEIDLWNNDDKVLGCAYLP